MDEANKDQPALRGVKKRGRPPKLKVEQLTPVCVPVVEVIQSGVVTQTEDKTTWTAIASCRDPAVERAQAYALRIWEGQSPDMPPHERLERVKAGVERQGMSMEGVTLP